MNDDSSGSSRRPRPVRAEDSVRPLNVREGMPGVGDPPEIEVDDRLLDVGGESWKVRAVGRARVGRGSSPAHLIQLVFSSGEGTELEALAVGRRLEDLTEHRLREAFRTARPYRPDRETPPFFEGPTRTGSRNDGR